MSDQVNHPSHYADGWSNGAEVIDITENLNFNRGNAIKYIARAGVKDPEKLLEDLQKAQWYLNREIARISGESILLTVAPERRVWMSLTDVPEDLPVLGIDDKPGDEPWLGEGPDGDTYYDEFGPFTEVLETDA